MICVRDGTSQLREYMVCVSDSLTDYRKFRKVRAPFITIDLVDGKIMIGHQRKGEYRRITDNRINVLGEICKIESPSYRYLSFNACVDRFTLFPLVIRVGGWITLTSDIGGSTWEAKCLYAIDDIASSFMFDDLHTQIVKDTKDWIRKTISHVVLNGEYSAKIPDVRVHDTMEDLI